MNKYLYKDKKDKNIKLENPKKRESHSKQIQ